jgi:hypothetical protein
VLVFIYEIASLHGRKKKNKKFQHMICHYC